MSRNSSPKPDNHVIVLFGATGDLAKRKLLPGFFHLHAAGLLPKEYRIIGCAPPQYALTDEWRNNAYGLYNLDEFASVLFPESGGPAGSSRFAQTLVLYRENRYIGKANLDWQFDRYNRLKLGGEFTPEPAALARLFGGVAADHRERYQLLERSRKGRDGLSSLSVSPVQGAPASAPPWFRSGGSPRSSRRCRLSASSPDSPRG